jgi:nucleotide-binding universal stress UspA family protein
VPAEVRFVRVLPKTASDELCREALGSLERTAEDETRQKPSVEVIRSDDVVGAVSETLTSADLVVLGLQRQGRRKLFGSVPLRIAERTEAATLMISRRG